MSNMVNEFITRKKDESTFLSLGDGESAKVVRLRELKVVSKLGFGGEEKEVLRLVVDVDTSSGIRTKNFDNGTQKFAQSLQDKGVKIGSAFTITRTGLQTKTKYEITNVSASTSQEAPIVTEQVAEQGAEINVEDIPM